MLSTGFLVALFTVFALNSLYLASALAGSSAAAFAFGLWKHRTYLAEKTL
jgi:hypothetical protein